MNEEDARAAFRDIADRLRDDTEAGRTTIRIDCAPLGKGVEEVAIEARDGSARPLEGKRTQDVRNGAAVRWLVKNRRTFTMEDCLNPWDDAVAPEDYVIELYGIRSEMVSGVFRGDDLVGIVSVHYTRGVRTWTDDEIALIERACAEVLVVLDKVEGR